jgi:hypothetical protein
MVVPLESSLGSQAASQIYLIDRFKILTYHTYVHTHVSGGYQAACCITGGPLKGVAWEPELHPRSSYVGDSEF